MTPAHEPLVVVLAGPNGAGKSTSARRLLQGAYAISEFVNADTIALGLSAYSPESIGVAAGRVMLRRLGVLRASRADLAFETTLSGRGHAKWLRDARDSGYRVHMTFLSLPDPDAAIARVAERVRRGGHSVPPETVRRRYFAGLRNFFGLYQSVADSWQLYDSSTPSPRLVASRNASAGTVVLDVEALAALERHR